MHDDEDDETGDDRAQSLMEMLPESVSEDPTFVEVYRFDDGPLVHRCLVSDAFFFRGALLFSFTSEDGSVLAHLVVQRSGAGPFVAHQVWSSGLAEALPYIRSFLLEHLVTRQEWAEAPWSDEVRLVPLRLGLCSRFDEALLASFIAPLDPADPEELHALRLSSDFVRTTRQRRAVAMPPKHEEEALARWASVVQRLSSRGQSSAFDDLSSRAPSWAGWHVTMKVSDRSGHRHVLHVLAAPYGLLRDRLAAEERVNSTEGCDDHLFLLVDHKKRIYASGRTWEEMWTEASQFFVTDERYESWRSEQLRPGRVTLEWMVTLELFDESPLRWSDEDFADYHDAAEGNEEEASVRADFVDSRSFAMS